MNNFDYRLGIDLGGTKLEAVLLDSSGAVQKRERMPTPRNANDPGLEYEVILETVTNLILQFRSYTKPSASYSIGVGIPGTIDAKTGRVQNANTTSLIGHPFQHDLETALGRSVGMENDANCFTLAEACHGAGKGHGMVFGVIMGTGCGGGLSISGKIHTGRHRIGGEWGHLSVDPVGAPCYCGNIGCVETKISGGGVEKRFRDLYGRSLTMQEITRGYRKGNQGSRSVFEQFMDDFGRCLGGLISILDPDAVVLGGGLSNIEELYTKGLEKVRRYAFHDHIETVIVKNKLGDSAGVFGAAMIGI